MNCHNCFFQNGDKCEILDNQKNDCKNFKEKNKIPAVIYIIDRRKKIISSSVSALKKAA